MPYRVDKSIFREYDIRGIAQGGKQIDQEFARRLGWAYSSFAKTRQHSLKRVALGRDCRLTSDLLHDGLVKGFRESGVDVVSLGVCPTPLTYFSLFSQQVDGAIMITGSHNDAEYNGFKICLGKDTLHGEQIQELRLLIESEQRVADKEPGGLSFVEIIPMYLDYVLKNARRSLLKGKRIVIDAGNGTAATVAPQLFEALGAEVVPLYCELDGNFPNHHPDPTVEENLQDLIHKVKETQADLGFGFDGDADRIGLVDEKGKILFGDELLIILSRQILKEHPGATIISEVKSSRRLYEDISKHGGVPIMWKTGHSLIKAKMKSTHALLAGEMSGHIFFADRYFGYDDAIYAAYRLFEIACMNPYPFSQLIEDLEQTVSTPEIRVDCQEDLKFALVKKTKEIFIKENPELSVVDIDGMRANFKEAWGLLRASNTSPVLVLRYEANTQENLQKAREKIEGALLKAAQEIGHPKINL